MTQKTNLNQIVANHRISKSSKNKNKFAKLYIKNGAIISNKKPINYPDYNVPKNFKFTIKNLPSKLFNWAARKVSGIQLHDFNCGLKVYRQLVIKNIEIYGEMHRYIPVIAAHAGFDRIDEKIVQHQARKFGRTKFGADRFLKGFLDLVTLWFINGFGKRPMHFFGFWGTVMLTLGFGFTLYLGLDKIYFNPKGRLITQRPEFYIALTTMILGTQLFIAGFLGEIMIRYKREIKRYNITKTTHEQNP